MKSMDCQLLGEEKVKKIYENFNLSDEEQKIAEEILAEWDKCIGRPDKKELIALEILKKVKYSVNIKNIVDAVLDIVSNTAQIRLMMKRNN